MSQVDQRAERIIAFWFGTDEAARGERARMWFAASLAFDHACREFLHDHEEAAAGRLNHWMNSARGGLALVLLLDQFPRNLFRGTPRAFATDQPALELARRMVAEGLDRQLPPIQRCFLYLPYEHSEDLAVQHESLRLFGALANEAPDAQPYLDYARQHFEVIERFGRFPHRNAIMGRTSTAAEADFLARESTFG